jgi:hypothetical protein
MRREVPPEASGNVFSFLSVGGASNRSGLFAFDLTDTILAAEIAGKCLSRVAANRVSLHRHHVFLAEDVCLDCLGLGLAADEPASVNPVAAVARGTDEEER